jgi:hypothetical protein
VVAGLADMARPAEKLSWPQSAALAATGTLLPLSICAFVNDIFLYRYNLGPIRAGHHSNQLHAVQCECVRWSVWIRTIVEDFQVGTTCYRVHG